MDGTIIDSEPYWMVAERELVERFGGTWSDEQGYALVGSGLWNSASLLRAEGVDMPHEDIISQLSAKVREQINVAVPWRPGVREMLAELLESQIPIALVTMSIGLNARALSEALDRELGRKVFDAIISADDVERSKPDPEAYLAGAAALGLDVTDTLAFEDSSFGAASAFSAGAVTIGIPCHVEIPSSCIHEEWETMAGKSLEDLIAAFQKHRRVA
jgi:HAD superfamily hydrolase (TIGR01509 family)